MKTIGIYISVIWIISMVMFVDARYRKNGSKYPPIELAKFDDLNVQAEVYSEIQRTLFLKITWNPAKTHNDSSFRVIINPIEGGICHHDLCDERGLTTHNATLFVPTKPTNPETSHSQCRIIPGCSYTIIIENDYLESEVTYTVPDRVGNVYSCQHELPSVKSSALIDSHQLMTIRWEIQGNYSIPDDILVYIVVIVTDVNSFKNKLKVFNHTLYDTSQRSGELKWKVPSSNVDYITRTFVHDSHKCGGLVPDVVRAKGHSSNIRKTNVGNHKELSINDVHLDGGRLVEIGKDWTVEGEWSGASFIRLCAARLLTKPKIPRTKHPISETATGY